jgi:D-sedoheptulose 7-phosphate isomerase
VTVEPTNFLYPFIDAEETDPSDLMLDLATSARSKMSASATLRISTLERCIDTMETAGAAMADSFRRGGRLLAYGNGGSATDAESAVDLFRNPPHGRALPALSLVDDRAVLTALSNDVGFELVFSRQIIAHARAGDIAVGFSTSGNSVNLLRAFQEASDRHLLTIGFCGYEGAAMATSEAVHHCLVVSSESVHRIQETQSAVMLSLWSIVQRCLTEGGTHD